MDLKKLRADVEMLKAKRSPSPIGRTKTGATAVLRKHFAEFKRMHEDGVKWTEIAAALAVQGVKQGDGEGITGRRVTALMKNIARQNENESRSNASRLSRKDVVGHAIEREGDKKAKLRLAPELTMQKITDQDAVISEDEIRRDQFLRHAHLLKIK